MLNDRGSPLPNSSSYLVPDILMCQAVWTSAVRAQLLLSLSPAPLSTAGIDACIRGFFQTMLEVHFYSVFSLFVIYL